VASRPLAIADTTADDARTKGARAGTCGCEAGDVEATSAAPSSTEEGIMRRVLVLSVLLVLCSAVLGATVFREQIAQAAQNIMPVRVVNTAAEAVPVREQGTPSVTLAGTPTVNVGGTVTVQPAREPFQQFVGGSSDGSEECVSLAVPEGKRLTLESLAVDGNGAIAPHVYVRIFVSTEHSGNQVRTVEVDLQPAVSDWAGVADVVLHSGVTSPDVLTTYQLFVCVRSGDGATFGAYSGIASGWLEDA
jgi:hypothetical protein